MHYGQINVKFRVISLETNMWSGLVLARPGFRIQIKYITKVKITITTS